MAFELKFDAPDFSSSAAKFKKAPEGAASALHNGLTRAAIQVQRQARINAPVRTGNLRNSILYQVLGLRAVVGSKLKYAEYVETGTGLHGPLNHLIEPTTKSILATKRNPGWGKANKGGYFVIGRYQRGMEGKHFMEKTYGQTKELASKELKTAVDNFVKGIL